MPILSFIWREIKIPVLLLFITLFGGALGYKIFYPHESWIKIIYATAITLTTVGFGDILNVEASPAASIYTILLIFLGMGMVLYSASMVTAFIIDGKVGLLFKERAKMKKISEMKNHFLVCGAGETGQHVVQEMLYSGARFIVIDKDEKRLKLLKEQFPEVMIFHGDATNDETLVKTNIKEAQGLIAVIQNDKDTLYLTFTARMLNPDLKIAAKSVDLSIGKKLQNAGAKKIGIASLALAK